MNTHDMSLRASLYAGILNLSGRRGQIASLERLRRAQFDSAEKTEAEHLARLGAILEFSYEHVPYYRELFESSGLMANDLANRPLDGLSTLPLLDKVTIRDRFDELTSDDLDSRKWHYNTSGGSTGEPVRFVQDALYRQVGMSSQNLFDEWSGYRFGQPKVMLWGSERDLLVGKETWRSRLGCWVRNEIRLNTFRMGEADMYRFVHTINRKRPVQLLSYVESAYELARFIERNGLTVHAPRAVMTTAGTLYPNMRETIERVFRAPAYNRYGSREVGGVASECENHRGLHINPYTHHVELLGEDGTPCGPGETGEVVVTLLTNQSMPLLRYRIGDMAVWSESPCGCGRSWPLLQEVKGRVNCMIRTASGAFDGANLTTVLQFKDLGKTQPFLSFSRYQLVQKDVSNFVVRVVVADRELWREEKPIVLKKLGCTLGEGVDIRIQEEDEIMPSKSGKHLYVYSEVAR